jgi:hypothetical protein
MTVIKFPEDFKKIPHHHIPGATQWLFEYNNDTNEMISVVGGGYGIHGDGKTTFEMWDTMNMHDPQGYMTADDINQWLEDNQVTNKK